MPILSNRCRVKTAFLWKEMSKDDFIQKKISMTRTNSTSVQEFYFRQKIQKKKNFSDVLPTIFLSCEKFSLSSVSQLFMGFDFCVKFKHEDF